MSLIPLVGGLIEKALSFIPNPAERERVRAEMEKDLAAKTHELNLAQVETNKVEAQHQSVFVAGWRPAIGWVCGLGLASYYIPKHVLAAVFWTRACWGAQSLLPYPIDNAGLMELTLALLGFGVLRSGEKIAGQVLGGRK